MKTLSRCCACMALWIIAAAPSWAQAPSFQFLQTPGPYPVGLNVAELHDGTRHFPASATSQGTPTVKLTSRPLQTLVWYPAAKNTASPMTVGDYAALADTEVAFDKPDPNANHWRAQLKSSSGAPLWAVRNTPAAQGRFPVVIYAPSDSSVPWENADLCEYLASHGYVVIASPSMGASTRDMTDDLEGIETQARDISYLITYAASLPHADASRVAVVSWSWGGISGLFAAARDRRIDALVAMDGSMRYFPGLVRKAGYVHADQMRIPLLFFMEGDVTLPERLDKYYDGPADDIVGPSVLNAWVRGDLVTAIMLGMSHGEFGAMAQRRKTAQRFAEDQVADYGRDDANTGYALVAMYTGRFLDAYLKGDAQAADFLKSKPVDNGAPRHFMAVDFRGAQQEPASSANAAGQ